MKNRITLSRYRVNYFLVSAILTTGALLLSALIYTRADYFIGFLDLNTRNVIWAGLFPAIILYIFLIFYRSLNIKAKEKSKSILILEYFEKVIVKRKLQPLTSDTKTAFLSILVKFFFFPIMLNTVIINGDMLFQNLIFLFTNGLGGLDFYYYNSNLMTLIFFLDTLIFAFSYLIESRALKSTIRSVEPTFFGWFIALSTYPPFNGITGDLLPLPQASGSVVARGIFSFMPFTNGFILGQAESIYMALHVLVLILFGIYLWATFALGSKASNLTNRGIVSTGPYKFIRHPAYIAKNLAWWLEGVIFATSPIYFLSMLGWNLIYGLRAWTEERHLSADPDYIAYKKKVKWMFIPGVI